MAAVKAAPCARAGGEPFIDAVAVDALAARFAALCVETPGSLAELEHSAGQPGGLPVRAFRDALLAKGFPCEDLEEGLWVRRVLAAAPPTPLEPLLHMLDAGKFPVMPQLVSLHAAAL